MQPGDERHFRVADQFVPFMVLPSTVPVYCVPLAVKEMALPLRRPPEMAEEPNVPFSI
jgi:hypothetical protein